jgi:thiol-disulfide isomerase/thioredoxin
MRARAVVIGGVAGLAAGLGFLYWLIANEHKSDTPAPTAASDATSAVAAVWPAKIGKELAKGELAAFVVKPQRDPVPDIRFLNEKNEETSLSKWRGRVVLINLWATWCIPCRKEMPALATLQKQLGGEDFEVVAISVDRKGANASAAFLIENGSTALQLYTDASAAVLDELKAVGLPASVLIDRQGREIGRLLGPAEWSGPDALKLIKAALAES